VIDLGAGRLDELPVLRILSDKLDEEAVRKRVITPDLDATIRAVIRDVAEGSELKD